MSILLYKVNRIRLDNERRYGPHVPQKSPLSIFWKLMPFFLVKLVAKRWCPTKRVNNTMYVEAFKNTFISIGKAE